MTIITPEDLGLKEKPIALVLDLDQISRIMRRHAMAAALVGLLRTRWVPEKENWIVQLFSLGEPGLLELDIPRGDVWRRKAESIFSSHRTRLERLCANADGAAVLDFVHEQQKATLWYKRDVARTFNEVRQLNQEIGEEAAWTTDKLFAIKTSAAVVFYGALTLSGFGLVAGTAAGGSFSLSTQFAMTRKEATQSSILAFTSLAPAAGAVGAKALVKAGGETLVKSQVSALQALKLGLAFDAAKAAQLRANPPLQVETPRMLPREFQPGSVRPTLKQANRSVTAARSLAKGAGFAASIYFLKDDIAKAMQGYSRSLQKSR